jgi:hypothetical protein
MLLAAFLILLLLLAADMVADNEIAAVILLHGEKGNCVGVTPQFSC